VRASFQSEISGSIDIKVAQYWASGDPALQSGDYLKLSVVDTGKGMTPEISTHRS